MLATTTAYGLELRFPAGDDTIGACLARYGEFARPELDFLLEQATDPTGVFIDVGANLGAICLPFAKARPAWRTLAIEAHRGLANVLAANAVVNQLYNVEPLHAAAGAKAGIVRFPAPSLGLSANYGTMSLTRPPNQHEPTQMLRLDDVASRDTRLVKIDVEGYELEVLRGAQGLLAAQKTTWVVEAGPSRPELLKEIVSSFRSHRYDLWWLFAPFATPKAPKTAPGTPTLGDLNIVATPAGAPPVWDLPPVDLAAGAPEHLSAHGYLGPYGYEAES